MKNRKTEPGRLNEQRRRFLACLLSAAVVFTAAAAVTVPAAALEMEPVCGLEEHQHSEACYTLYKLCAYGEATDTVEDRVLICGLAEEEGGHRHTEECYHEHTEDCFSSELICPLPEHLHDDSCYAREEIAETVDTEERWLEDNTKENLPSEKSGVPEGIETVPEDTETLPKDTETLPKDTEMLPEDTETVPKDTEMLPEDTETVSEDTETIPEGTEPIPEDTEQIPEDTEQTETTETDDSLPEETDGEETMSTESTSESTDEPDEEECEPEVDLDQPGSDEVPVTGPRKAARLSAGTEQTRELTVARVSCEGEPPEAGEFTFCLYDGETLIGETTNAADGSITFTVSVSGAGIRQYTVAQKPGDRTDVNYDSNRYTITVAVEDNSVISTNFRSDLYYGLTVQSGNVSTDMTYRFYMSTVSGNTDYRVLCIDHGAKQTPSIPTTQVYWVAEVEPSEEMLLASVCNTSGTSSGSYYSAYDGWCDALSVNLKKLLYSTFYGANSNMTDLAKQTLAWQMTQGLDSVTVNNARIISSIVSSTAVPSDYRLVLFHPSDGSYQSFVTLLPSTQVQTFQTNTVTFVNTVVPEEATVEDGYELPSTGGPGRIQYTFTGMLLLSAATVMYIRFVRRRTGGMPE